MSDQEDDSAGIPEWVVTFGDMMSLLLTFFIMLVSLSEIKEEEKFQALVESIKEQLGHSRTVDTPTPGPVKPRNSKVTKIANMGRAKRLDLMKGGDTTKAPQGDYSKVRIIDYGNRSASGFTRSFAPASDALKPEEQALIDDKIDTFLGKPQLIEIRGHTSRKPLSGEDTHEDHWKLAFQRCMATKAYFVHVKGIDPERIRITLAGPNEPMFQTPDEIDGNDRVSVFLLDQTIRPSGTKK
jgi:chemotaxis protein MotB